MAITCLLAPTKPMAIAGDDWPPPDADGQQSACRDGHHQARSPTSDQGKITEQPKIEHATWEQLRGHASFPLAATTIETGVADTPAGQFRARIYTVRKGDDVSRFYFADERPGPPVLFYTEKAGVRAITSVLVPNPPPVACKTDDDCWIDDQRNPIARPRKLRGKKPRACKDSESIPACDQSVCVVRAYKC
jgi:hypothetical protein